MKLTKLEKRLLKCLQAGEELNLAPQYKWPTTVPRSIISELGVGHEIRASVIREILRGTLMDQADSDPRGLKLRGAKISGRLDLEDVECLIPLKLTACYLPQGINAESARFRRLELRRCVIEAPEQHKDINVVQSAVCLTGARIEGQMSLTGSELLNKWGPALLANQLNVEGDLFLRETFRAEGEGEQGAVRLTGARVGGQLNLANAVLINETGPALSADGLSVEGDLFLDEEFHASGNGANGAIRFLGMKIGGQLSLTDAEVTNKAGPALVADRLLVDGDLFLDGKFRAIGNDRFGAVRLKGAKVSGLHICDGVFEKSRWEIKWVVDGLTYEGIPTTRPKSWLKFLRKQTLSYATQPYQQLATNFREAGREALSRKTLISQRSDQLRRGNPGLREWCWGAFTWIVLGYGYRPWLLLLWLVAVFATVYYFVTGVYSDGLSTSGDLIAVGADSSCSGLEQFQVVVDMVIPLVSTGVKETCQIVSREPDGEAIARISMAARGASWALLTLFIAGFTRIVRRSEV